MKKIFCLKNVKELQSAFTLLEVLVSLFLFSIASLGMGKTFANTMSINSRNERRTAGVQAVQRVLDLLRSQPAENMPSSNTVQTSNITIGFRTFIVTTTFCPTGTIYCNSTMREIKASASLNGSIIYETNTVYTKLR